MKVLTFLPRCDLKRRIDRALSSAQFVVETVVSAKECLLFTRFAQYSGVLVDSDSLVFEDTLVLVKYLRQENSDAALFVFARYLDLEQRLRLFEAGVDDCVREPFFASELAVRLGLSIRLHQAASDVAGAAARGAVGQGHRSAAQGIPAAGVPGAQRQPPGYPDHDPGARLELFLRRPDQRSRRLHQRVAQQSRPGLPPETDSDQSWHRVYVQLRKRISSGAARSCELNRLCGVDRARMKRNGQRGGLCPAHPFCAPSSVCIRVTAACAGRNLQSL